MAEICVTGGCGYVGTVLVPKLLSLRHRVHVVDIQWFGNRLIAHPSLSVEKKDIREDFCPDGFDIVIHLAAIANDPAGELNPKLTWETNALATMRLADACARAGVKRFIYASSGSVYGVKGDVAVTEDELCLPVSEYNKAKMVSERAVLSYSDRMSIAIIRPGTVCGYSPRQRLDITVNGMTIQALTKGKCWIAGKELVRANIHIEDMTDLYAWLLENPIDGIYNAAFEDISIGEIGSIVSSITGCETAEMPAVDKRSYRINSEKLISKGFIPNRSVRDAVNDLVEQFRIGNLKDDDNCYNLRAMPK